MVPRSDMQTTPHASFQPDPHPRFAGSGPHDDDDKPICGGVLPIFLFVGFHGALIKGILQILLCVGGFRNVLRKSTKANLLVTFQYAVLLLSLFDDVIFFDDGKIATKTFWKTQSNVSPVCLSFVGPAWFIVAGWALCSGQVFPSLPSCLMFISAEL